MADYSELKNIINAVVKQNGNEEITGEALNHVLISMVESLGANYSLAGVATPDTNPGTPDQNVFYFALVAGTYVNFDNIELPAGISIFKWNGTWTAETFFAIDSGSKSNVRVGEFNAGNITEEGWYDQVTSGRPAGSDDDEYYLLYMSTSKSQICFSKKNSSKIFYRANQEDEWQKVSYSVHRGEFNANDITEEGWYDSITLGRPEGSESDEKYFLYMSSNGGQTCFSRRNSGKAYHRLGLGHPWVSLNHDDYSIENPLAAFIKCCSMKYSYTLVDLHSNEGYASDGNTGLTEYYSGNDGSVKSFIMSRSFDGLQPNDIIRVRCAYRRGMSAEGTSIYKYDSDAYIFLSTDAMSKDHSIEKLRSNYIKVKPLGGQNYPFTEGELGWQDLAFMRDKFFNNDYAYGWHYLRVTAEDTTKPLYLNIYGDFSTPGSWFVFDRVEVYRAEQAISPKIFNATQALFPEGNAGSISSEVTKLLILSILNFHETNATTPVFLSFNSKLLFVTFISSDAFFIVTRFGFRIEGYEYQKNGNVYQYYKTSIMNTGLVHIGNGEDLIIKPKTYFDNIVDKILEKALTFPSDPQTDIHDANQLVQSGITGYVTTNIPEDATGWGSLSVRRATTVDGEGYTSVEQTFYGRVADDLGKIWKRLGFIDRQGDFNPMRWCKIAEPVVNPLPVEGDVQIFDNLQCTRYATGVKNSGNKIYARVNIPWSEPWTVEVSDFGSFSTFTNPYKIQCLGFFNSAVSQVPYTAGQIVELTYDYYSSLDITDAPKVFTKP